MGRGKRGRSRKAKGPIREVWTWNFEYELKHLDDCLRSCRIVTIDTEFPGSIRRTPWGATEEKLFDDFRFNVNQTKLIQLGLTLSDELGNIASTWEFNFCDFDPQFDAHNASSVLFLKQNGLDFHKLKTRGIPLIEFAHRINPILRKYQISRWVTFHGLYDIGYFLKAIGVVEDLPESMTEFTNIVEIALGNVSDLKHMARYCEGLEDGKLGLEKLAQLLNQKRIGKNHHAGSDSLLTASLYVKMKQLFEMDSEVCDGYLYGLTNKFHSMDVKVRLYQKIMFGHIPSTIPIYYQPCHLSYY